MMTGHGKQDCAGSEVRLGHSSHQDLGQLSIFLQQEHFSDLLRGL